MSDEWPSDVVGWTTIAANIATVFTAIGAISIAVILRVKLNVIATFQRRSIFLQEVTTFADETGLSFSEVQRDLLNKILYWAENSEFSSGPPQGGQSADYREYVARLVALFDLVLMDKTARNDPATLAKIRQVLSRHSVQLATFSKKGLRHVPVSGAMAVLIGETLSK